MFIEINGFLPDEDPDDSLKFELAIDISFAKKILKVLGHRNLNDMAEAEWLLTESQVNEVSSIIGRKLPSNLALFIGLVD